MKAAVLTNFGDPLEIWDIDWEPLRFGQVKVKMISSGICGAQLQEINGEKGNHLPRLMGHEGCGIVTDVGLGVKTVLPGDKVVLHWRKGAGIESENPEWNHLEGRNTSGLCTVFSDETVVSENRVTKVPMNIDSNLCTLLGCSLSTALGVLENDARLKIGESILIIGFGGLGSALYHCLPFFHPGRFTVVDRARKGSVPHSFFAPDWEDSLKEKFDVVVDTTGDHNAIETGVRFLNPSGRFIMVGQPKNPFMIRGGRTLFDGDGFSLKATQGGGFQPEKDIPRYITLPDMNGIITHFFTLSDINEGLDLVRKGQAGRVIINL